MWIPKFLKSRLWYGHLAAATVGAMVVGFVPAAMMGQWTLNTHLDTIGFPTPLVALVLGFILARKYPCDAAIWVWAPPLLFFAWDAHGLASGWNPSWSNKTRWQYVNDNLLGVTQACSDSECLGELFVTMPFVSSICYSVGVAISKLRGPIKKLRRVNPI